VSSEGRGRKVNAMFLGLVVDAEDLGMTLP
jgi:hypothetical protein